MKKFLLAITMIIAFSFSSYAQYCDTFVDSIITAGTYTGQYVLNANKIYKLVGKVYIGNAVVGNNASLTIPAGTLIFGDKASKAALVITRGAKGFFNGTALKPIVFTSCFPAGQRNPGDWGGLMILGAALNNRGTEVIEGGFDPVLGQHGGNNSADNSGVFRYVRVEFSGVPFTTDDETNGITMGSVGSGTEMDHLQTNFSGDDGFEWFGGSNNMKYLISYKTLDDDFDTDHGYIGNVQYGVSYRDKRIADVSNSEAFESDNDNSPITYKTPRTAPNFSNFTAIGPRRTATDTNFDPEFYHGVHQRRNTLQSIYNSAFSGWDEGMVRLDGNGVIRALQQGGATVDTFKFSHITFAGTPNGSATGNKLDGSAFTLTDWNTWYNTAAYNNQNLAQPLDLNLVDQFNDLNPNLTPNSTSPLAGSGTNPNLINSFFDNVNYRGAFPPVGYTLDFKGRWDLGWANYNPQATPYGDIAYTISNTITVVGTVGTRSVVFGRAPGATDGIDAALGEVVAPPLPPADEIDIRWQLASDQSVLDIRSDANTISNPIVYTLKIQWGSGATGAQILTWDSDHLTGGAYTLKDGLGGVIFPNVNMRTQNSLSITNLALAQVVIEVDYDFSGAVTVGQGWNLVSAMGNYPTGNTVANWWAGKDPTSSVFKYNTPCDGSAGYAAVTSMTVGQGVWMKNSTTQTYNTSGEWSAIWYAYNNPINICTSWNLVSGLDYVAEVAELGTVPNNLITGAVFGYVPGSGYQIAVTMDLGKAYWLRSTASGQLIIPGPLTGAPKVSEVIQKDWGKIILSDNAGNSYTLYSTTSNDDLSSYELPPLPPAGIFDVRFGSQRFVENLSSGNQTIDFTGIEYPVKIKVEGMNIKVQDVSGKIVNNELRSGQEVVIYNNAVNKLLVTTGEVTPDDYVLEQNYPNPFNPSTTIKFSLPEASNVSLFIYNTLGERVAQLVNTQLQAGKYSYQWDASNLASGLYFYELRTENFVSTKKMILMK